MQPNAIGRFFSVLGICVAMFTTSATAQNDPFLPGFGEIIGGQMGNVVSAYGNVQQNAKLHSKHVQGAREAYWACGKGCRDKPARSKAYATALWGKDRYYMMTADFALVGPISGFLEKVDGGIRGKCLSLFKKWTGFLKSRAPGTPYNISKLPAALEKSKPLYARYQACRDQWELDNKGVYRGDFETPEKYITTLVFLRNEKLDWPGARKVIDTYRTDYGAKNVDIVATRIFKAPHYMSIDKIFRSLAKRGRPSASGCKGITSFVGSCMFGLLTKPKALACSSKDALKCFKERLKEQIKGSPYEAVLLARLPKFDADGWTLEKNMVERYSPAESRAGQGYYRAQIQRNLSNAENAKILEHAWKMRKANEMILYCQYMRNTKTGKKERKGFLFWYEKAGASRAEMEAISPYHPALRIPSGPVDSCPPSMTDAERITGNVKVQELPGVSPKSNTPTRRKTRRRKRQELAPLFGPRRR